MPGVSEGQDSNSRSILGIADCLAFGIDRTCANRFFRPERTSDVVAERDGEAESCLC